MALTGSGSGQLVSVATGSVSASHLIVLDSLHDRAGQGLRDVQTP